MSNQASINQKEYLKKYLSIGKDLSAKKKKKKKQAANVKIIDDDLNDNIVNLLEDDPFETNEDAPQIVAVIDERPPSMRIDDKTKDNLWKPLGGVIEQSSEKLTVSKFKINKPGSKNLIDNQSWKEMSKKSKSHRNTSPTRKNLSKKNGNENKQQKTDSEGDRNKDSSPPRRHKSSSQDSDSSPPRTSKVLSKTSEDDLSSRRKKSVCSDVSSPERRETSDLSPPRRTRDEEKDISPKRRLKDDDSSPPRRRAKDNGLPPRRRWGSPDISPTRRRRDKKDTPPKRRSKDMDSSPPRRRPNDDDYSPPRRKAKYEDDLSPPRNRKQEHFPSPDQSPPRRSKKTDSDFSSRSNRRSSPDASPQRKSTSDKSKMKKTLDGKMAGLQNAIDLVRELKEFKKREQERFKKLSAEESGVNAKAVLRDRKTGKVRNLEQEALEKQKKEAEENKRKEKYDRWGRGLKQVEDTEKKAAEMLHEMSKPLARYADDEDLERHLKERECEGDPMLAYFREKKRKQAKEQPNFSEKPEYKGEFMPNRYGIRPGHRWDGVDRSNGYEKKYFEVQNQKKAAREEMHAWSMEDM